MARVKGAMMTRKRRNKVLKLAKGYWGSKSKHFRVANQAVMKSLKYAYVGRRLKKRDFRSLWITRISAACKLNGMNYSTFMHGLKVKVSTVLCAKAPRNIPGRFYCFGISPRTDGEPAHADGEPLHADEKPARTPRTAYGNPTLTVPGRTGQASRPRPVRGCGRRST